ncbi:MAG TPA: hypothetical protein VFJ51_09900 [Nitrososphaeraceae archaeon]|nr:hypothetical protein [Nitrososphaeraceae archaeon]
MEIGSTNKWLGTLGARRQYPKRFKRISLLLIQETILELNGCHIEAYPPYHIDAFRALDSQVYFAR